MGRITDVHGQVPTDTMMMPTASYAGQFAFLDLVGKRHRRHGFFGLKAT